MTHRPFLLMLGLTAALFTAGTARADEAERANKLRAQANTAADAKDWATCKKLASEAWGITKSPLTAGTLGVCEAELGDSVVAAEHLDYALRLDDSPARRAIVQAKLDDVKKKVAVIVLTGVPANADVKLNGDDKGTGVTTLYSVAGQQTVEVAQSGYETSHQTVDVTTGSTTPVSITLSALKGGGTPSRAARPFWPGAVLVGLGVVGLAAGTGTAVASNAKGNRAESFATSLGTKCSASASSGDCATAIQAAKDRNTLANASMGTFLAGGILGAAGVGLLLWAATGPGSSKGSGEVTVIPVFGAEAIGVNVGGRF